jgi:2-amino-4-hydroxy-6-hydroxymethyldihydropteridine diphosphokinase
LTIRYPATGGRQQKYKIFSRCLMPVSCCLENCLFMFYYIGVGSNLGDRLGYIRKAIALLKKIPGIDVGKMSPVYETPAEGGPAGQPDYLNLVFELKSAFSPETLLGILKGIEKKAGRSSDPVRWAPREIDLDILLCGDVKVKTKKLRVPHPMMEKRYFVLRPLADLAPQLMVPGTKKNVEALLTVLKDAPKERRYAEAL